MNKNDFDDLIQRISYVSDIPTLEGLCYEFVTKAGFHYFVLTIIKIKPLQTPEVTIYSNVPSDCKHSLNKIYESGDFLAKKFANEYIPRIWSMKNNNANSIFSNSNHSNSSTNVESLSGLIIPLRSTSGDTVSLIIASEEDKVPKGQSDKILLIAHCFLYYFFERYQIIKNTNHKTALNCINKKSKNIMRENFHKSLRNSEKNIISPAIKNHRNIAEEIVQFLFLETEGEYPTTPSVEKKLMGSLHDFPFTNMEGKVVNFLLKGLKRGSIASKLGFSCHAFDFHMKNIKIKCNVKTTQEFLIYAYKRNWHNNL